MSDEVYENGSASTDDTAELEAMLKADAASEVVLTRGQLRKRSGFLVENEEGELFGVTIEPIVKKTLGKVSEVNKKGEKVAPHAIWNLSAYSRVTINTGEDRESLIEAGKVGKQPILFSPASFYSPATGYEIAIKDTDTPQLNAGTEVRKTRKL